MAKKKKKDFIVSPVFFFFSTLESIIVLFNIHRWDHFYENNGQGSVKLFHHDKDHHA